MPPRGHVALGWLRGMHIGASGAGCGPTARRPGPDAGSVEKGSGIRQGCAGPRWVWVRYSRARGLSIVIYM